MKAVAQFLVARAKEPSTLLALSLLGAMFGMPPGVVEGAGKIIMGVGAVGAALLPDSK